MRPPLFSLNAVLFEEAGITSFDTELPEVITKHPGEGGGGVTGNNTCHIPPSLPRQVQ